MQITLLIFLLLYGLGFPIGRATAQNKEAAESTVNNKKKPPNIVFITADDLGYKLICFYEDERVELYDLTADIGEQNDLSTRYPILPIGLRPIYFKS